MQDIKRLSPTLKKSATRASPAPHVYCPWGMCDSIDKGERYLAKRIAVNPGAKLSVQMHQHRAEYWIVVTGTAKVNNGEKPIWLPRMNLLTIPIRQVHALENPGAAWARWR